MAVMTVMAVVTMTSASTLRVTPAVMTIVMMTMTGHTVLLSVTR